MGGHKRTGLPHHRAVEARVRRVAVAREKPSCSEPRIVVFVNDTLVSTCHVVRRSLTRTFWCAIAQARSSSCAPLQAPFTGPDASPGDLAFAAALGRIQGVALLDRPRAPQLLLLRAPVRLQPLAQALKRWIKTLGR